MTAFELAVSSGFGVEVARRVGADRIEVCAALEVHGVTPSIALIERAVAGGVPAHVLVRSRPGDFEYSRDEVELMVADARRAVDLGAAGVVVGGTSGGDVDASLVSAMVDLPFALPTAVAGIALTALYADTGWIGSLLAPLGIRVTLGEGAKH